MKVRINGRNVWLAVISHFREDNVPKIIKVLGHEPTFYVNDGEKLDYTKAGAKSVRECGNNICKARNEAILEAKRNKLPCIQISDDLKGIKKIKLVSGKRVQKPISVDDAIEIMMDEMHRIKAEFGGVAVTSNALNYQGQDFSYDKLIVNDLVCIMNQTRKTLLFDNSLPLKEDYDICLTLLTAGQNIVRCNNLLCNFPHRENKGGANGYRPKQESIITKKLFKKWGNYILPHKTRPGQVSLNYKAIASAREQIAKRFKHDKEKR